jgi:beta-glucosidase
MAMQLSEWDLFSHTKGKTAAGATGDVADRSYDLYDVDVALLQAIGFKHYRFSLSWGRLITDEHGTVNKAGK